MWIDTKTKKVFKTYSEIRTAFKNCSLPIEISDSSIEWLGLAPVTPVQKPVGNIVEEIEPVFLDNRWVQQWSLRTPTAYETDLKSAEVRESRDAKLAKTDWVVAKAYEQQSQIPSNYVVYRQALRDITQQPGFPWEVVWPTL